MERRLKRLCISTDLLLSWLRVGADFVLTACQLPEDTTIVESRVTEQCWVELTLHSDEWPIIAELAGPPMADTPTLSAHHLSSLDHIRVVNPN
jgi:hypothetical protein